VSGPLLLSVWDDLEERLPAVVDIMRRYLQQIGCILRPGSVTNTDGSLRCLAAFLAERHPRVSTLASVRRRHIEEYKPWLAALPRAERPAAEAGVDRTPAGHAADVLRPHPGMGLARGAGPDPDPVRRCAPAGLPAAQCAQ
jgi:hypothetical protein